MSLCWLSCHPWTPAMQYFMMTLCRHPPCIDTDIDIMQEALYWHHFPECALMLGKAEKTRSYKQTQWWGPQIGSRKNGTLDWIIANKHVKLFRSFFEWNSTPIERIFLLNFVLHIFWNSTKSIFFIIFSCLSICLMHPVTWWVAKEYEVDKSNNKNGQAYDLFPLQSMVYLNCSSLWVAPPQQTLSSQLPSPVSSIKASEILKPCHVQLSQTW